MKFISLPLLAGLTGLAFVSTLHAQLLVYSFGPAASPTTNPTLLAANLSASAFSGDLGSPGTGGTSPLFSAGSGGGYFTASAWTGVAPGTNYFSFTLTPDPGYAVTLSGLSFGDRSTATGPSAFAVLSSADNFTATLVSGTLAQDSAWHSTGTISLAAVFSAPTTFRIYASGASNAGGTLRLDDVTVYGGISAVPEPSVCALLAGAAALSLALWRRKSGGAHLPGA